MHIVMTDLDGVIFDDKYCVTTDLNAIVKQLAQKAMIVPNSNTPTERLAGFFKAATGVDCKVIIGENGAVVSDSGELVFTCRGEGVLDFRAKLRRLFENNGFTAIEGPIPVWIREKKRMFPNRAWVLIDNCRMRSVSVFLLTTDNDGNLVNSKRWCEIGSSLLDTLALPDSLSAFAHNPNFGIFMSDAANISKTSGYALLKEKYPAARFYMIGDTDHDIIGSDDVTHLSVANATRNLKDRSAFVANSPYATGFKECLEWICEKI